MLLEAAMIQSSVTPEGRLPVMANVGTVIVPPPVYIADGEEFVRQKLVLGRGAPEGTVP